MPIARKTALALFALAALAGPAARAQTVLGGHHDHNPKRLSAGYKTTPARTYTVAAGATFDDNRARASDGLDADGSTVLVTGGSFSGNDYIGLFAFNGAAVAVHGGDFSGNTHYGLVASGASTATVTGGIFARNYIGLIAYKGAAVRVTGGTFRDNSGYDLSAGAGASLTLYGTGLVFHRAPCGSPYWGASPKGYEASGTRGTTTLAAAFAGSQLTGTVTGTLRDNASASSLTYQVQDGGRIVLVNAPSRPGLYRAGRKFTFSPLAPLRALAPLPH